MNRAVNKRGKMLEAGDYCLVDDDVQIDDLPENCIYDILGRLPLESLCTTKLVCKSWYGIVSSTDFRSKHVHRSDVDSLGIIFLTSVQNYSYLPPPKVFCPESKTTKTDFPSSFHLKFMEIKDGKSTIKEYKKTTLMGRIIATCNGLIVSEKNIRAVGLILLNPVTREVEDIPQGTISSIPRDVHGLAFCHASRRYKLLHLFMTEDKVKNLGCEIMDIGSGLWRAVDVPPTERPHSLHSPVFAMGALHWIQCLDDQVDCMVSMPLDDEKFKTTAIPAKTGGGDHIPFNTVFAMGGFLGLSSRTGEANQIGVWILRGTSDECRWEKQYDIDGSGFGYLIPLYCDGDDQLVFKRVDGCFFAYDRHSRLLTKIETTGKWAVTDYWTIFPHVNSLVSWRS